MTGNTEHRVPRSGDELTEDMVSDLAAEAMRGYDVEEVLARRSTRGRPRLGSAPATVESVRLDPELRADLIARATAEGRPASEVIREALRRYLGAA